MVADQIIQQLCVTAGSIMEDASVAAVSQLAATADKRYAHLLALRQAGEDIAALLAAAEVLMRRRESESDFPE